MINRAGGDLLQWLRGFYNVVKWGSVVRAAEQMGLRQSAISHQIKNLEKEFAVPLFHRSNKALRLTAEGQVLYEKTLLLFDILRETRQALLPLEGSFQGEIALSVTHTVAQNHIGTVMKEFYTNNSQVSFLIRGGSFAEIVDDVMRGNVDAGIVNKFSAFSSSLECRELFGARLLVVSPAGNPFNLPEECSLQQLRDVPFLSFCSDYAVGTMIDSAMQRYGIPLRKILQTYSYNVLLSHVQAGLGVTILDAFAVQDVQGIVIHNLVEELPLRRYTLIRRTDRFCPPQTKAFLEALVQSPPPRYCTAL